MKLLKLLGKILLAVILCIYALNLFGGGELLQYRETDNGGVVSVAGRSINVDGAHFKDIFEAYADVEETAGRIVPSEIRRALDALSERLAALTGGKEAP